MRLNGNEIAELSRFMGHVRLNSGPWGNCWDWQGSKPNGQYGHFSVNGQAVKAHRYSYSLFCQPIPDGQIVRHRCDNPACVNPAHLELGTYADNTRDAIERGRWFDRSGEKHPLAKITAETVVLIRDGAAAGATHQRLANEFGLSRQHIGKIVRRENWDHI